ncbi:MAG: hypothetical protein ACREBR_02315 [bacterium]
MILEMETEIPEDLKELTENSRNCVVTTIKPILRCLRDHFDGDEILFQTKWRNLKFKHSKFGKVCNGEKDKCSLLSS